MKRSPIPSMILCLILALLLLFPCTPYGQRVIRYYFPSVNLNEEALLSSAAKSPAPETSPPVQEQTEVPDYSHAVGVYCCARKDRAFRCGHFCDSHCR